MPPQYGPTPDGFRRKTREQILDDIEAKQRADVDPNINTQPDSPLGKMNAAVVEQLDQAWEALAQAWSALDRNSAEDAALDLIGELTATPRRDRTRSRVTAIVILESGANIAAGEAVASVEGNPAARFVNAQPMVNSDVEAVEVEIAFVAETPGPVIANANTLTVIETQLTGWTLIENEYDAVVGLPVETNPEYRLRQVRELQAQGGGTVAGIRSDVARTEIDGEVIVTAAEVLENPTAHTDANGLPPKSFEVLVDYDHDDQDAAEQAIANAILKNKPAAVATHGALAVAITDPDGTEHVVRFTAVEILDVHVAIHFGHLPPAWQQPDSDALRAAVAEATRTAGHPAFLGIGANVYATAVLCALLDAGAHPNVQIGLSLTSIATPGDGSSTLAVGVRQRARIDSSDVVITYEDA
jgi:uncharacterized phage protein gp47/JayE